MELDWDTCTQYLEEHHNAKVLDEGERAVLCNMLERIKVELRDAESWANDVEGQAGFSIRTRLQSIRYMLEQLEEYL